MVMRLFKESMKTKILAFNTVVREVIEYASQVWSPQMIGLSNTLEKVQNNALRWIFWLRKIDSITLCRDANNIPSLSSRRTELDITYLRKVEFGLFDVKLSDYIRFNSNYSTRGKAISWPQRTNIWKNSYYNRMRSQVKVHSPPGSLDH